jgi:putative FmdB family regulatory protein
MPIYAYRCGACGHAKDVLQKLSDPVLTTCPSCGAETFSKQVTAAGFQLKGSGWYVTDFRDGGASAKTDKKDEAKDGKAAETKPDAASAPATDAPKPAAAAKSADAAAPASAPAPTPSTPSAGT